VSTSEPSRPPWARDAGWAAEIGKEIDPAATDPRTHVTTGIVVDDDGFRLDELVVSGEHSEWFVKADAYLREHLASPTVRKPRLAAVPVASHVEVQVAMLMREFHIQHLTVVINNDRICSGFISCPRAVAAILPRGSSLTVWTRGAELPSVLEGRR
jgi:hypothetical protein